MEKDRIYFIKCIGIYLVVLGLSNALDIEPVLEGSCSGIPNTTTSVNMTWLNSVRRWYTVGGSKFHFYRATLHNVGGEEALEALPEHTFYYESCFQMTTFENGLWAITGYEPGRVSFLNVTDISPGARYATPVSNETGQNNQANGDGFVQGSARHYITLTDNRTFMLFSMCFLDLDEKAWGLYATTDTLSPQVLSQVEDFMITQGFDRKRFVFMKYNDCRPGVLNQSITPPVQSIPTTTTTTSRPWNAGNRFKYSKIG